MNRLDKSPLKAMCTASSSAKAPSAPSQPFDNSQAMMQALEWQVILWSGEVTADEQSRFHAWKAASKEHAIAWEHVQRIDTQMQALPDLKIAAAALRASSNARKRRTILRAIAVLLTATASGAAIRQTPQWAIAFADIKTDYGSIESQSLADGSQIQLNSASAVNIFFSEFERRIQLLRGEILVQTAANGIDAQAARPFLVETAQGVIHAIGTEFNVKMRANYTEVAVLEGMVDVRRNTALHDHLRLRAGEQTRFDERTVDEPKAITPALTAWTKNRLVVEQISLGDFAKELEHYRKGFVQVDPAVAHLRLSGSFALNDTDKVLQSLPYSLPVRLHYIAPLWVRIVAA